MNAIDVGSHDLIGADVLPGVKIGDDLVIAAGAVAIRNCEAGHLDGGTPARRLR